MPEADVVVAVGASITRWKTRFGALLSGAEHVVQVDVDPARLGVDHPIDLGVAADARHVATALLESLDKRGVRVAGWRTADTAKRMQRGANNEAAYDDVSTESAIEPRTVTKALDRMLPIERTVVTDGGHFSGWPTRHLRVPDTGIVTFPMADFAEIARGHGADGVVVTTLDDLEPVGRWLDAGATGVFVLDVRVNASLVADWLTEALHVEQR